VVDAPDSGITGDTALLYLPGFDSMKLVQIVEEVEAAAGIEIDPERITPEAFASPGTIAETIARHGNAAERGSGLRDRYRHHSGR
jgi:acyl carrier protein